MLEVNDKSIPLMTGVRSSPLWLKKKELTFPPRPQEWPLYFPERRSTGAGRLGEAWKGKDTKGFNGATEKRRNHEVSSFFQKRHGTVSQMGASLLCSAPLSVSLCLSLSFSHFLPKKQNLPPLDSHPPPLPRALRPHRLQRLQRPRHPRRPLPRGPQAAWAAPVLAPRAAVPRCPHAAVWHPEKHEIPSSFRDLIYNTTSLNCSRALIPL